MQTDEYILNSSATIVHLLDTSEAIKHGDDDPADHQMEIELEHQVLSLKVIEGKPSQFAGSDSGCLLWSSAEPLAQVLWSKRSELCIPGACAVELGCGCGLASLVLAAAGMHVMATDRDNTLLEVITKTNIAINLADLAAPIHIAQADWGEFSLVEKSLRALGNPPVLLVASDVLYEPDANAALARTIREFAMLASSSGFCFSVVLSWQERSVCAEQSFLEGLADILPVHRTLSERQVHDFFADTGMSTVRVCQFSSGH
mmetsp:Transcript_129138/g.248912  ORF Transcript_129138/g.248912 Transcript_129138/m.248912 type:complete len:259 (+) Transcript_129138:98-874(+)